MGGVGFLIFDPKCMLVPTRGSYILEAAPAAPLWAAIAPACKPVSNRKHSQCARMSFKVESYISQKAYMDGLKTERGRMPIGRARAIGDSGRGVLCEAVHRSSPLPLLPAHTPTTTTTTTFCIDAFCDRMRATLCGFSQPVLESTDPSPP